MKYLKAITLLFFLLSLFSCTAQDSPQHSAPPLSLPLENSPIDYSVNDASCEQSLADAEKLFFELENYKNHSKKKSANSPAILTVFHHLEIVIDNAYGKAQLQSSVHPDKKVRDQADLCIQKLSSLYTNLGLSKPVYEALNTINVAKKDKQARRYLKKILKDFRRSGVDKDDQTRERIRELNLELTKAEQLFSKNIREDVRSLSLNSAEQLAGLPDDYIKSHQPNASGKIIITTDYPDFFPIARYAESDELRKEMYILFKNRGYPVNEPVLKDILKLRYELANLLGYEDYATYITEDKMIRTPRKAQDFIDKVSLLVEPIAKEDYQVLLQRLQQSDPKATAVKAWQKEYLAELVRRESYDFDSKQLRQYFNYNKVESGIFALIEDMFLVKIIPWETSTWHESVKAFKVIDSGVEIGRFFLDMHPRENKYKHAAHFPLVSGVKGQQLPVSVLVCNFPGENNQNSLMEHAQVETFLHEFGHLLHHIFAGQQQWIGFSGVATERDFIEAPSQMLEEWVWHGDILKRFAINDKGETIPDQLIDKMLKAKFFGEGLNVKTQMFYAALSLNYYQQHPDNLDLSNTMIALNNKYSNFEHIDGTHFYANFGHLVGYSAMYYTYMWSLVIAADLFSEFEQKGLLAGEVSKRYRNTILAPGGSEDADVLVESFLGRPYDFNAFKNRLNDRPE